MLLLHIGFCPVWPLFSVSTLPPTHHLSALVCIPFSEEAKPARAPGPSHVLFPPSGIHSPAGRRPGRSTFQSVELSSSGRPSVSTPSDRGPALVHPISQPLFVSLTALIRVYRFFLFLLVHSVPSVFLTQPAAAGGQRHRWPCSSVSSQPLAQCLALCPQ